MSDLPLHGFPNVEEDDLLARVDVLLQRLGGDLEFFAHLFRRTP
jgi:hypothetical protein